MIARFLILLVALLSFNLRAANSVTLAWDPSPDTNVAGYYLCHGFSSGNYTVTNVCPGPVTNCVVYNLIPYAVYFFAVAAYSKDGLMSDWSNEVTYTNNPAAPLPERMRAKKINSQKARVGTVGMKR